jgi:hypothetical protein
MRRLLFTLVALALMLAALPTASHASGLPSLPDEALLTDPIWARNGFANLAYAFTNRTRYLIALNVDHRRGILSGKARVLYVNNDGVPHNEVIFRLYPNHPVHQGRRMQIAALSVNGVPSAGQLRDASGTVLRCAARRANSAERRAHLRIRLYDHCASGQHFLLRQRAAADGRHLRSDRLAARCGDQRSGLRLH